MHHLQLNGYFMAHVITEPSLVLFFIGINDFFLITSPYRQRLEMQPREAKRNEENSSILYCSFSCFSVSGLRGIRTVLVEQWYLC
jgi:hypothetical protein